MTPDEILILAEHHRARLLADAAGVRAARRHRPRAGRRRPWATRRRHPTS